MCQRRLTPAPIQSLASAYHLVGVIETAVGKLTRHTSHIKHKIVATERLPSLFPRPMFLPTAEVV